MFEWTTVLHRTTYYKIRIIFYGGMGGGETMVEMVVKKKRARKEGKAAAFDIMRGRFQKDRRSTEEDEDISPLKVKSAFKQTVEMHKRNGEEKQRSDAQQ